MKLSVIPKVNYPLLVPMSEVAGRMAVQIGAHFLTKQAGGSGVYWVVCRVYLKGK